MRAKITALATNLFLSLSLFLFLPLLPIALAVAPHAAHAAQNLPILATGQLIYVPAYGQIHHGAASRPFHLSITLSVHNTDPKQAITLTQVDYYSTAGTLISRLLAEPLVLAPLATREFVIREKNEDGGSGDNFLVRWRAAAPANPPIAESVMIGTASTQGISFTSRGVPIQE